MRKSFLAAALFLIALAGIALPQAAEARVFVSARFGCCGYYPYPYPYYPAYYPYYVAPPPVVYTVPPASPVVYAAPPVAAPAPAPVAAASAGAPAVTANQTSPTFIDSQGRTCRQFQSTSGGQPYGTACLQPDGTWRAVQ